MKIIVDMMGGDNAPLAVLEGAAQAVKEYGVTVVGVGDEALVLICCWTVVPMWSAAPRCWRRSLSWAAAM